MQADTHTLFGYPLGKLSEAKLIKELNYSTLLVYRRRITHNHCSATQPITLHYSSSLISFVLLRPRVQRVVACSLGGKECRTDSVEWIVTVRILHFTTNAVKTATTLSVASVAVRGFVVRSGICLLYTSPSPRDKRQSRMPSSA